MILKKWVVLSIVIFSLIGLVVASTLFPSLRLAPSEPQDSLSKSTTVYAYGPNGLLSKQVGGEVNYYHTDYLSSSSLVTDNDGKMVYQSDYEPFGDSLHVSGEERYTYTGKELDSSTGLYYYGARYYDASLGRFVSVDPVQGSLYSGQRLNRYTYVLNNPMVYTDPSGMDPNSENAGITRRMQKAWLDLKSMLNRQSKPDEILKAAERMGLTVTHAGREAYQVREGPNRLAGFNLHPRAKNFRDPIQRILESALGRKIAESLSEASRTGKASGFIVGAVVSGTLTFAVTGDAEASVGEAFNILGAVPVGEGSFIQRPIGPLFENGYFYSEDRDLPSLYVEDKFLTDGAIIPTYPCSDCSSNILQGLSLTGSNWQSTETTTVSGGILTVNEP